LTKTDEFKAHLIDGPVLLELTDGELRDELGVESAGSRSAILSYVETWNSR
jgi:DNA-directed RNA polymerase subunit N (RpoN/RPB10)